MKTDQVSKSNQKNPHDFEFDSAAINLFEDVVIRSVPFYVEIQRMISEIAFDYAKPDTSLYDLGCSTGTTMLYLDSVLDKSIRFIGIDKSAEMLDRCSRNFIKRSVCRPYELLNSDLNNQITITNASVVILCLTLQYVRPVFRHRLLKSILEQLNPKGCIIIIEQILGENVDFNRRFINYYSDLRRRNNCTESEIAQTKGALKNVQLPYKLSENLQLMVDAGFRHGEIFFKWYNFAGFAAIK